MDDRILVVDDNEEVADALVRLLVTLGYEAKAAYSGEEAINLASTYYPDLAFIDIAMPGLNGYETVQAFRRKGFGHVLFVALTGFAAKQDRQRAYDSGFDFHVAKPMSLDTLKELLSLLDPMATHQLSEAIHRIPLDESHPRREAVGMPAA